MWERADAERKGQVTHVRSNNQFPAHQNNFTVQELDWVGTFSVFPAIVTKPVLFEHPLNALATKCDEARGPIENESPLSSVSGEEREEYIRCMSCDDTVDVANDTAFAEHGWTDCMRCRTIRCPACNEHRAREVEWTPYCQNCVGREVQCMFCTTVYRVELRQISQCRSCGGPVCRDHAIGSGFATMCVACSDDDYVTAAAPDR